MCIRDRPPAGHNPSYAGLFILDSDEALEQRLGNVANTRCDPEIMTMLQTMLTHHNPYAQIFKFVKHYMLNTFQMYNYNSQQKMRLIKGGIICQQQVRWQQYLLVTMVPVSYTHLDVYKRQAYACPPRIIHFSINIGTQLIKTLKVKKLLV